MFENISNAIAKRKIKRIYRQCKDDISTDNLNAQQQNQLYLLFHDILYEDSINNNHTIKVILKLSEVGLEIFSEKEFELIKLLPLKDIKRFSKKDNNIWQVDYRNGSNNNGSDIFQHYIFRTSKALEINQRVITFLVNLKREEDKLMIN
ncbi:hypothetical protein DLAC_05625 [Tieghemostelium lacteum]|uniref:Uncharacterized protein n=1 Tax=Tieghemostelium lacteum TaxID=361077 RepID=A0A151ZGI1_TIELA|nr:hypothetical protein DLAC_05625 [Tieghemostelium lacteum]|eukprot:KYQ93019.1 hypothetical protein DLAC_05625 [Tieghemostelium lacteum]